ncbi:hypothetical protein DERF_007655 [Dermatophagoides farinae]|uniref:Uncharacterized protein n=1 Tax=Dermatophagoides farinae TaxID=6954 RepID=A0A922I3X4_DERFA|nr:hypothetical protein DERF_016722 [Dermatophagoides farinae]KAH9516950.1 hypothetical protein DERF_007655 [Dermatophagoides farinae]
MDFISDSKKPPRNGAAGVLNLHWKLSFNTVYASLNMFPSRLKFVPLSEYTVDGTLLRAANI